MTSSHPVAEFDSYAHEYEGGAYHPLTKLLGGTQAEFNRLKAEWLLADLRGRRGGGIPLRQSSLLEFGCGTGELLQCLRAAGFEGSLAGCDLSRKMLDEAAKRWDQPGSLPLLHPVTPGKTPFADRSFDVVAAACVFHHIPPAERGDTFGEMLRIVKPGGRFYLFEHNPLNPVTTWIVRRAPVDRNAVLLRSGAAVHALRAAGFKKVRREYYLFFPPRLRWLRAAEGLLKWCALGAQYAVVAQK